jgi:hypothetical protein
LSLHSFSDNAAAENDLRRDVRKEGQAYRRRVWRRKMRLAIR